jgi:site-specific recombinase XerC
MCGIRLDDLDMKADQVTVRGKGDRVRILPFGTKTGTALERYLRLRAGTSWPGWPGSGRAVGGAR